MKELELKYGCNPNQKPSKIFVSDGRDLPIRVLSGRPGYINFMDALNGWQLVTDMKAATGLPSATSFKHVSPAGAAVGLPLSDTLKKIYFVDDMEDLSPIACAYARARGADRMSSFGDFISLSDVCDASCAKIIKREVSDGVIAPGYTEEALEILKTKKNGNYNVIEIDPEYRPAALEHKDVFGITFEQGRNELTGTVPRGRRRYAPERGLLPGCGRFPRYCYFLCVSRGAGGRRSTERDDPGGRERTSGAGSELQEERRGVLYRDRPLAAVYRGETGPGRPFGPVFLLR